MKYVYILERLDSQHFYVGITDDLRARLAVTGMRPPPRDRAIDLRYSLA
jgi:GIY-YIG catalytic domain